MNWGFCGIFRLLGKREAPPMGSPAEEAQKWRRRRRRPRRPVHWFFLRDCFKTCSSLLDAKYFLKAL